MFQPNQPNGGLPRKFLSAFMASVIVAGTAFLLLYALVDLQQSGRRGPGGTIRFEPAHRFRAKSRITINHTSNRKKRFFGRVFSKRPKCRKGRQVILIKTRGPLSDIILRRTKSRALGKWSVRLGDKPRGGYYAKVIKRIRTGYLHYHRCRGATSKIIRVARRRR